jgi:hypothetical protein
MIHARRLLNINTNMSAQFEEKHELMLMSFANHPKAKQRVKAKLRLVAHVSS